MGEVIEQGAQDGEAAEAGVEDTDCQGFGGHGVAVVAVSTAG